MSVELEIQDGDPWWLSPDIWTVPGNDPTGTPGTPIAGSPCYLWARVHNNGKAAVSNATVRFYWANPSVGFDRTTANPIGTSFVSLAPGESQDVLCLTPWLPVYVNDGHECVLAEAFHPSLDPLPMTPSFNVPTDRHVAQRNLGVVMAVKNMFRLSFEVHNNSRKPRAFRIVARQASLRQTIEKHPWIAKTFKLLPQNEAKIRQLGFTKEHCPSLSAERVNAADDQQQHHQQQPVADIKVGPQSREGITLMGTIEEKGAALVHVQQWADKRLIGGLSSIIINAGGVE
jgi:hypothetical protein